MKDIVIFSDPDAEVACLACIILNKQAAGYVLSELESDDFHDPRNKTIFESMVIVYGNGLVVDRITVLNCLKSRKLLQTPEDTTYIANLTDCFPIVDEVQSYVRLVREQRWKRQVQKALNAGLAGLSGQSPESVIAQIMDIGQNIGTKHQMRDMAAIFEDAVTMWEKVRGASDALPQWVHPGLRDLLGPLFGSRLIVIAGGAKDGKTSLMFDQARFMGLNQHPAAFCSLEMSDHQMMRRFAQLVSGRDVYRVEKAEYANAILKLQDSIDIPLHMMFFERDVRKIGAHLRRLKVSKGIKAAFIDYLGLIKRNAKVSTNDGIGEITGYLKSIAGDLDIDIILGCQLSRNSRREKRQPEITDFRDSGNIEQDMDIGIIIDRLDLRDQTQRGTNICVVGNRDGLTGDVHCRWDNYRACLVQNGVKPE